MFAVLILIVLLAALFTFRRALSGGEEIPPGEW